jgi:hypothetical protein
MAIGISNAFVQLFDAEVKQAYQGARALAGVTRERMNVEGNPTVRVPQTDVTPLNVTYSQVTASMSDYIAAEYSDIFHQAKVNFDERRELVKVVGDSIGRRMDQLVLDALAAASSPSTVGTDIGGVGTNLNLGKLLAAKKALDTKNVPSEGRCMIIHANGLSSLLDEQELTSSDFASVKALVQGEIDTFLGFKFITLGDRDEGGLPLPSTRTSYAFHRDAVGLGVSMAQKTEINYVPERQRLIRPGGLVFLAHPLFCWR